MMDIHIREKLTAAYKFFQREKHRKNMEKIRQLAQKVLLGEYGIAFAGHFSAGKSRMINELLGEKLLPSSPIPTSANLVRVGRGEGYARVYLHGGKTRRYEEPYDYALLQQLCREGETIREIELRKRELSLPPRVVVMDTPGIDSADDAHKKATEDALHLADIIFYVMDYNHVQAEINLSFTASLTKAGKEVYLVINQIDKHVESELSFAEYKRGIEEAFSAWGVEPAGYFYTSLKEPELRENQFTALKKLLQERMQVKDEVLYASVEASLEKLLGEYIAEEESKAQEVLLASSKTLENISPEEQERLVDSYEKMAAEVELFNVDWQEELNGELELLLENAYLMPTSTRDLARDYLISCQKDFKIGFFGRGKKTIAEMERRQELFFADASKRAKSQIEWHLKNLLTDFCQKYHFEDEGVNAYLQAISIEPSRELLTQAMSNGAKVTQDGSYVIRYTENFAEGIKNTTRAQVRELIRLMSAKAEGRNKRRDSLLSSMAELEERYQACLKIREMSKATKGLKEEIENLLLVKEGMILPELFTKEKLEEEIIPGGVGKEPLQETKEKIEDKAEAEPVVQEKEQIFESPKEDKQDLQLWSQKLRVAGDIISRIDTLKGLARELRLRGERLEKREVLVTLFGAFSAGKSSFANAILGESLLPVSPNPTTAAINKILPVTEENPHGTVIVTLKTEEMLLGDVNLALRSFGLKGNSLAEARELAQKALLDKQESCQREKAFLRAFLTGWSALADKLGTKLRVGLGEFAQYAAKEDKSCFTDSIEVFYDCEFTRMGVVLTDTPGADSINARHTKLAMEYIKNSDAVLFVTYYNHAFNKADREFLIQLGRVKDAFSLDKMFFIINAIDLAESTEEAEGVCAYIRTQLQRFGVRRPRLFALSSQQLLKEKLRGEYIPGAFERAFNEFVFGELSLLVGQGAKREYQLARERLEELVTLSKISTEERRLRGEKLQEERSLAEGIFNNISSQELYHKQSREIQELLHYVKERVFFRFIDFYREAFNPSTLQEKNSQLLKGALEELINSLGFDFAQELRATLLRLEIFAGNLLGEAHDGINGRLLAISNGLVLNKIEVEVKGNIDFPEAFQTLDRQLFKKVLSIFKGPKAFFEQGGSKIMEEELRQLFLPEAEGYLVEQEARLQEAMRLSLEKAFGEMVEKLRAQLEEKFKAAEAALGGQLSTEFLESLAQEFDKIGSK